MRVLEALASHRAHDADRFGASFTRVALVSSFSGGGRKEQRRLRAPARCPFAPADRVCGRPRDSPSPCLPAPPRPARGGNLPARVGADKTARSGVVVAGARSALGALGPPRAIAVVAGRALRGLHLEHQALDRHDAGVVAGGDRRRAVGARPPAGAPDQRRRRRGRPPTSAMPISPIIPSRPMVGVENRERIIAVIPPTMNRIIPTNTTSSTHHAGRSSGRTAVEEQRTRHERDRRR